MLADAVYRDFLTEAMPHFTRIKRVALKLAADRNDAEDLVQETFMQAWNSFGRYKLGTNCRAWLLKILMNKYMNYRRGFYKKEKHFKNAEEFVFTNAHSSATVSEHLTNTEIIRALNKVPESFRMVVILIDVHEFSYKEASRTLGIPIGTVMSRLHRGRSRLRKVLVEGAKKESSSFKNNFNYFLEQYV